MNGKDKIKSFTDLVVWKEGHSLIIAIYGVTKTFPREEVYLLIDQMRRSASSVTSNVAEGFGRRSYKEKIQFYYIAQGSLIELKNHLLIARDIGYLPKEVFERLAKQTNLTHKLLQGLITKSKSFVHHKS